MVRLPMSIAPHNHSTVPGRVEVIRRCNGGHAPSSCCARGPTTLTPCAPKEDILALEQRAEKSKEGERLFASAQKAFAGGLFQRALEESSLAKQLFLDSSTQ